MDGSFADGDNWDGGLAPTAGQTAQFGVSSNRTITGVNIGLGGFNSPPAIIFSSSANGNYDITRTGGTTRPIFTVEESAFATEHVLNSFAFNSAGNGAINIQGATSLRLNSFSGVGGSGTMNKTGVGSLIFTGTISNVMGSLAVSAGTVDFRTGYTNASGAMRFNGDGGMITSTSGSPVTVSLLENNASTASYSGVVAGNLNVIIGRSVGNSTLGVQTFAGNNSYTGTTTIYNGVLIVNGVTSGQGSYAVLGNDTSAGTLAGSGALGLAGANTVTVGGGATLAVLYPGATGADTSTLDITAASVNFLTNSALRLDIGSTGASDSLNIVGDFSLGNDATLDLHSLAGAWDGSSYTLVNWTDSFDGGAFASITGLDDGYQINYLSNAITLTVVPEPSVFGLFGLGLAALFLRRRKGAKL